MSRLAVIQRPPVLLDRERTLSRAVAAVAEAAAGGDSTRCGVARRSLDVAGHYARPDLFELRVDRRPHPPVAFD